MRENDWVALVINRIQDPLRDQEENLAVSQGTKLAYVDDIRSYSGVDPKTRNTASYQTDILVFDQLSQGRWIPRVIIEAKLHSITTHTAIVYSEKALAHKQVHPYLRYGILIGRRPHQPLPGRLFRHGTYFDFMLSWTDYEPSAGELNALLDLILEEVQASRRLEEIVYDTRSPYRKKFNYLHRSLRLKQIK
jgi:hypothetical protein